MINTSGHFISAVPRYEAPNASLLAFNPVSFMDGIDASIARQRSLERLRMEEMANEEARATIAKRILAANAGNEFSAARDIGSQGRLPLVNQVADAKDNAFLDSIGALTAADIAAAKLAKQMSEGRLGNAGSVLSAEKLEAEARGADARRAVELAAQRTEKERATTQNTIDRAKAESKLIPGQSEIAEKTLADQIKNLDDDIEVERAKRYQALLNSRAEGALKQAQALLALDRGDSLTGREEKDLDEEIQRIQRVINDMMNTPIATKSGARGTVSAYVGERYETDPLGGLRVKKGLFSGARDEDPIAENIRAQVQRLSETRDAMILRLHQLRAGGYGVPSSATQPAPQQTQSAPAQKIKSGWTIVK